MIKQVLRFSLVLFGLFFVSFWFHQNYIEKEGFLLPFDLEKVYLFHLGFSLLICVNFQLLSAVNKIFEQLGFIYLVTIVLKIVLFGIIFYSSIFKTENLTDVARISLLIPTLLFLLTEAIFVIQILNKNEHVNNS